MNTPAFPSPARRAAWVAAILIISLVLMACGLFSRAADVSRGLVEATVEVPVSGDQQAPVSTETPLLLQSALPRGFRYAGLDFQLQKAAITTQPPEGAILSDQRGAYAQTVWRVANPGIDPAYIQNGVFALQLGSETFTIAYDDGFNPQDTRDLNLVFSVPAGSTWTNATITFGEPGKVPAALSLEGDASQENGNPQKLSGSGGQALVKIPPILYVLTEAAIDLDAFGQRAEAGTHYLLLTVTATCKEKYACYVGPESFRVLADGAPYGAQRLDPAAEAVDPDTTRTFRLAVQIPDGTQKVELLVGEAGKDQATIPIQLDAGP